MTNTSENDSGASHRGGSALAPRRWPALVCLNAVFAVTMVDGTILYPALRQIRREFGSAASFTSWLVAAYLLTFGALLWLCHRVTERVGPRRVLLAGVVLFALSSGLAVAAWSLGALLLARSLQGAAAAMIAPTVAPLLRATLHNQPSDRLVLRLWAAIGALGGTVGLVLGGTISAYLNWRYIFLGYVVVAAGALLLMPFLSALAFDRAGAPAAGPRGGSWRLLRRRGAIGGAAVMLLIGASFDGTLYLLALYGQQVLGYSPVMLAAALGVVTLASAAGSLAAQAAAVRRGPRAVAFAGTVLVAAAAVVLLGISVPGGFVRDLLAGVLLMGLGIGAAFVAAQITIMLEAAKSEYTPEHGLADTAFVIGGATGLIVLSGLIAGLDLDFSGAADGMAALAEVTARLRQGFGFLAAAAACTVAAVALLPGRSARP